MSAPRGRPPAAPGARSRVALLVSLELLYRGKPTVVVYRIGRIDLQVCKIFMRSRFISLVNLLADDEVFPEFLTDRCQAAAMSGHLLRWINEPNPYRAACERLAELRERVAAPGACARAADYVLEHAAHRVWRGAS